MEKLKQTHFNKPMSIDEYRRLYPDLIEEGGMLNLVRKLVQSPTVTVNGWGGNYVHVQCGNRSGQIFIRAKERQFDFDLWQDGIILAEGEDANFHGVVHILNEWVTTMRNAEDFERETGIVKARANHPKSEVKPGTYIASGNSIKKI